MKIAVTGANGFLGRGIVKELLDNGHQVVAVSRNLSNVDNRAYGVETDVFNMDNPYLDMQEPEVVLHLAWVDGFQHNSKSHLNNLANHFDFLDKVFSSPVKMVSVMGTVHEIGFYEGVVNGDTPTNPSTFYGIAKNTLRQLTIELSEQYDKKYQWLRAFYIVDSNAAGESIFSKITRAVLKGDELFPFVDGKNQFDFLSYDDFAKYVAKTVTQYDVQGIINIASGYPQSIGSVVERFLVENSLDIKLDYGRFPSRKYDSKAIWGDSDKINKILENNQ